MMYDAFLKLIAEIEFVQFAKGIFGVSFVGYSFRKFIISHEASKSKTLANERLSSKELRVVNEIDFSEKNNLKSIIDQYSSISHLSTFNEIAIITDSDFPEWGGLKNELYKTSRQFYDLHDNNIFNGDILFVENIFGAKKDRRLNLYEKNDGVSNENFTRYRKKSHIRNREIIYCS